VVKRLTCQQESEVGPSSWREGLEPFLQQGEGDLPGLSVEAWVERSRQVQEGVHQLHEGVRLDLWRGVWEVQSQVLSAGVWEDHRKKLEREGLA